MEIAVLGTGQVGTRIATALAGAGHHVVLGSRAGGDGTLPFAEAAAGAEAVFNCLPGAHSVAVVESIAAHLDGKVLIDLANPLDFSRGFPPALTVCNTDSLAERIQRAAPGARVVKALNMVANHLMVAPRDLAGGDHDLLLCGDDAGSKRAVAGWLTEWFGWRTPIDLGGLDAARGMEAWLLLWTRLYGALGTGDFNLKIVRGG